MGVYIDLPCLVFGVLVVGMGSLVLLFGEPTIDQLFSR